MRLFDYDSPVMHFLSVVGDIILLNLLYLLTCLPLITIGAANTALFYTADKLQESKENLVSYLFSCIQIQPKEIHPILARACFYICNSSDQLFHYYDDADIHSQWFGYDIYNCGNIVSCAFGIYFPNSCEIGLQCQPTDQERLSVCSFSISKNPAVPRPNIAPFCGLGLCNKLVYPISPVVAFWVFFACCWHKSRTFEEYILKPLKQISSFSGRSCFIKSDTYSLIFLLLV